MRIHQVWPTKTIPFSGNLRRNNQGGHVPGTKLKILMLRDKMQNTTPTRNLNQFESSMIENHSSDEWWPCFISLSCARPLQSIPSARLELCQGSLLPSRRRPLRPVAPLLRGVLEAPRAPCVPSGYLRPTPGRPLQLRRCPSSFFSFVVGVS